MVEGVILNIRWLSCYLLSPFLLLAYGCASHPKPADLPQLSAKNVVIVKNEKTGDRSVVISVLIYNVAGLPWPIRSKTGPAMARLRVAFQEEFSAQQPDVLMLQEAFVPSATSLVKSANIENFVTGPSAGSRTTLEGPTLDTEFKKARRRNKGEKSAKLLNSGLVLATNYGINNVTNEPFGKKMCAGFDCMSNKGLMLVELDIPGVPAPLFILNTHLNSRGSSGVANERSLYAHNRQVDYMVELFARDWKGRGPLIYGGDFNTRNSADRFEYKDARLPGELAHRFCYSNRDQCAVELSWDSDEPWLDTQDLQGYANGGGLRIEPVAIAAVFDQPVDGKKLSDHDALKVTYRISWTE